MIQWTPFKSWVNKKKNKIKKIFFGTKITKIKGLKDKVQQNVYFQNIIIKFMNVFQHFEFGSTNLHSKNKN